MSPEMLDPNRRRFLHGASAAGAFFAAHGLTAAEPKPSSSLSRDREGAPFLRRLELLSSAPLAAMQEFYHNSLGLSLVEKKP
jgi:hypothetical protein